ncbi:hypothetical protein [Spirulina subsalsa]|uniref:hypothetical protein n=1 Tax=Spirulina subsalsa TaxID=54311 RepID=UPI0002FF7770|nr:hypothetical protein [Spirulina subsalsa]
MPPTDEPLWEEEFNTALAQVEQSLQDLKQRRQQVQQDSDTLKDLQQQQQALKGQKLPKHHPLKTELEQIEEQIHLLEVQLESRLFRWQSLQEPFWQAVRFGGLGIVLGWLLKSCTS